MTSEELAGKLEPYLIAPPWTVELLAHFPDEVKEEALVNGSPTGLGHHPDYGWFALGCGQGPFIIWVQHDPNEVKAPKPAPEPDVEPQWAPSERTAGYVSYCPSCGSKLRVVTPDDPDWGEFCNGYRESHGTEWFLCEGDGPEEKGCVDRKAEASVDRAGEEDHRRPQTRQC